jgi:hypothetical protein
VLEPAAKISSPKSRSLVMRMRALRAWRGPRHRGGCGGSRAIAVRRGLRIEGTNRADTQRSIEQEVHTPAAGFTSGVSRSSSARGLDQFLGVRQAGLTSSMVSLG